MAIDTQQKRMSAAGAGRPWIRSHLAGEKNQAWRMAAGHSYSGNPIAGAAIVEGLQYTIGLKPTHFTIPDLRSEFTILDGKPDFTIPMVGGNP